MRIALSLGIIVAAVSLFSTDTDAVAQPGKPLLVPVTEIGIDFTSAPTALEGLVRRERPRAPWPCRRSA